VPLHAATIALGELVLGDVRIPMMVTGRSGDRDRCGA
jgi:hypothetical protein